MRKWIPRCSREREVFPATGCQRGSDPIHRHRQPGRSSSHFLSLTEKAVCFGFFFFLYSQLLCTHDTLIAVLLPRGIPDRIIFSSAGKFPFLEEIPKLSAVILWKRQKHGLTQMCWQRDASPTNPQRIIHPMNYVSNTILFPWGVTQWKTIVCLMCSLKL